MASGTVKAEGLSVQAQAESGILIKEHGNARAVFGTVATVSDSAKKLYPASTNDLSIWYHTTSDMADKSKYDSQTASEVYADTKYQVMNALDSSNAPVPDDNNNENTTLKDYRLVKQFIIRSASDTPMTESALAISKVDVTGGSLSENFNKAIRVGVKVTTGAGTNSAFYVYAPKTDSGFTLTAGYLGSTTGITENKSAAENNADILTLASDTIPANDAGLIVSVFVWYEGEDPDCKTSHLINATGGITPDDLSVSVTFANVAHTTT